MGMNIKVGNYGNGDGNEWWWERKELVVFLGGVWRPKLTRLALLVSNRYLTRYLRRSVFATSYSCIQPTTSAN